MIYVISSNTLYNVYTRILFAISIIFLNRFTVILNYVGINFGYYEWPVVRIVGRSSNLSMYRYGRMI